MADGDGTTTTTTTGAQGAAGGDANGAQGAAGAGGQGDGANGATTGAGDGGDGDHQGGDQVKLTAENRSLRQRLRAAEEERDRYKGATQSEVEKANDRATKAEGTVQQLQGELRTLRLERAVARVSGTLGIIDPDGAQRMLEADAIEYDDDGRPVDASVKRALQALVKEKPYLVRQGGADAGDGNTGHTGTGSQDMNAILRAGRGVAAG